MVLGKRSKSADRLTQALQSGDLTRVYLAWLVGRLTGPTQWQHWILKDEKTNTSRVVGRNERSAPKPGAKSAALKVTPVDYGRLGLAELTLAEFQLETGRSHQIRVQSSYEGFPLLGDAKYSAGKSMPDFSRPALHSSKLSFPHPITKERLSFEEPLPQDMEHLRKAP